MKKVLWFILLLGLPLSPQAALVISSANQAGQVANADYYGSMPTEVSPGMICDQPYRSWIEPVCAHTTVELRLGSLHWTTSIEDGGWITEPHAGELFSLADRAVLWLSPTPDLIESLSSTGRPGWPFGHDRRWLNPSVAGSSEQPVAYWLQAPPSWEQTKNASGRRPLQPPSQGWEVSGAEVLPQYVSVARGEADKWRALDWRDELGIDINRPLRLGDDGRHVLVLLDALAQRGFIDRPVGQYVHHEASIVYDEWLEHHVMEAQRFFGLVADGIAGPQLYAALSKTSASMADGLTRWADLLDQMTEQAKNEGSTRLVVVNLPSFSLTAIDLLSGESVVNSRVVIGLPSRRTPATALSIIDLKLNPDWSPPPSLISRGRVYTPPGPNNPLGLVRFSTNTTQNIYLHDTNEPEMYDRSMRALSAGCVRVQQWMPLASFISGWSPEYIQEGIDRRRTVSMPIHPVPVRFAYSLYDAVDLGSAYYPDIYPSANQTQWENR